jgi:hypothetical protein
MTPQEEAGELVERFASMENNANSFEYDKQCALIAVDAILNLMIKDFKWDVKHNGNIDYWQEVKQAIKEL